MDLVTQQEGMQVAKFRHKVVGADMTKEVFDTHWSSLPVILRLQLFLLIPIYAIYLFFFGTRETIAKNIALDDLPSSKEILYQDETIDKLDSLLIDKRDLKLAGEIEKVYRQNSSDSKVVGIVYGAAHMRNITKYLMERLNYRITDSEWLTIFDL
jgi:pheromone shutdown protein TraB